MKIFKTGFGVEKQIVSIVNMYNVFLNIFLENSTQKLKEWVYLHNFNIPSNLDSFLFYWTEI